MLAVLGLLWHFACQTEVQRLRKEAVAIELLEGGSSQLCHH